MHCPPESYPFIKVAAFAMPFMFEDHNVCNVNLGLFAFRRSQELPDLSKEEKKLNLEYAVKTDIIGNFKDDPNDEWRASRMSQGELLNTGPFKDAFTGELIEAGNAKFHLCMFREDPKKYKPKEYKSGRDASDPTARKLTKYTTYQPTGVNKCVVKARIEWECRTQAQVQNVSASAVARMSSLGLILALSGAAIGMAMV